jgi:hypothetical protein
MECRKRPRHPELGLPVRLAADASIGIAPFLGLGKDGEALNFLNWLLHASRLQRSRLRAVT